MYELIPMQKGQSNLHLFFRLEGEAAERHGAIGCMRADFGRGGNEFYTTWFDNQTHLKTPAFKTEFDNVINSLCGDGEKPPFASRRNLESFCRAAFDTSGGGAMIRTQDYSYYFRCKPAVGDYDIYCFAFDNRYLLPELAGKHELPEKCFSVLPSTGERILIWRGQSDYDSFDTGVTDRAVIRAEVDKDNARWGVTRAQEEAMLAGSMFGWNTPAAKPWHYDKDGNPRLPQQKKNEPER